jgi:filamentous hemagglutinin
VFEEVDPKNIQSGRNSNEYLYVVKADGTLVIGRKRGAGHIDLAGGESVRAAGHVKFVNGEIKEVNNNSGHYQPHGPSAEQEAIRAFQNVGFSTVPYKETHKRVP